MFLDHLRPAVALVTLCLIFVQGRAHQAQQLPSAPPVAPASLVRTAPVLDGRVLDDPAWQDVPALVKFWQTAPTPYSRPPKGRRYVLCTWSRRFTSAWYSSTAIRPA